MLAFSALELGKFDPENDIIIVSIFVSKMPPQRVRKYVEQVKMMLAPKFKERGFDSIFWATRKEPDDLVEVMSIEEASEKLKMDVPKFLKERNFDAAMKIVE